MSEAPLEVLVIGNSEPEKRLSLPQQLVDVTFSRLKSQLQRQVRVTQTSKENADDFLPSSRYAAVIIDPDYNGRHDDDWLSQARKSGLLNGQKIFFLSRTGTCQREMRYAVRSEAVEQLAYRIAGKKETL